MKIFTPDQARKTLPLVRKILDDILLTGQNLNSLLQEKNDEAAFSKKKTLEKQLQSLISELEEIGCHYADWSFEKGLVDFPAVIDDKEVFLCWRGDEQDLLYFHERNSGYAGRKLIPEAAFEII